MRTRSWSTSVWFVSAEALLVGVLTGPATGQVTSRVSVASGGAQGNDDSGKPSISADGRCVTFQSFATNLIGGDTNGWTDVFVHDRQSGANECASVDSGGAQANDNSNAASISSDGRYVSFESLASNLVAGDTNGVWDIFVHDRQGGATERVSVESAGAQGINDSRNPSISADGRYVAFRSLSKLVGGDTNGDWDVFVHDRQSGVTERASVDSAGAQGNDDSGMSGLSISADGRHVAFESHASNLVVGDTNGTWDVFFHDRQSDATERVSVDSSGGEGNDHSYAPAISADARYVAFESAANNLVSGDTNGSFDTFVHDRQSGTTTRVSVDSSGTEGNGFVGYYRPSISNDGRYVAFGSDASNLVSGDTNGVDDVFVHDCQSGTTERVSVDSGGAQGNIGSRDPSISADGRYVAFGSDADNLVSGDTNGARDAFVRDREAGVGTKYCTANANSTGSPADLSASGSDSSASGNLTLSAYPVPNQFGIFFHGMTQVQMPFGNGYLCVTNDLVRGTVIHTWSHLAFYRYDNSDAKHSLVAFVGTTRNFQYWFRDPMGGGAFFNTSNAISIAILP